jgi:hypothetical protein
VPNDEIIALCFAQIKDVIKELILEFLLDVFRGGKRTQITPKEEDPAVTKSPEDREFCRPNKPGRQKLR